MDIHDSDWLGGEYGWPKSISGWDLEFMGKENEASIKLRQKLEDDKEKNIAKRHEVWQKVEPHLLQGYKECFHKVPNIIIPQEIYEEISSYSLCNKKLILQEMNSNLR